MIIIAELMTNDNTSKNKFDFEKHHSKAGICLLCTYDVNINNNNKNTPTPHLSKHFNREARIAF